MEILLESKTRTTIQFSNPTPEHVSRESHTLKRYKFPNVHCSSIYTIQDMEAT